MSSNDAECLQNSGLYLMKLFSVSCFFLLYDGIKIFTYFFKQLRCTFTKIAIAESPHRKLGTTLGIRCFGKQYFN